MSNVKPSSKHPVPQRVIDSFWEYAGANLYVTSKGHRLCRECNRLRAVRRQG